VKGALWSRPCFVSFNSPTTSVMSPNSAITQVLQWIARRLVKLDVYGSELTTNGDPPWKFNWKAWKNDKRQEMKSTG